MDMCVLVCVYGCECVCMYECMNVCVHEYGFVSMLVCRVCVWSECKSVLACLCKQS